MSLFNRVITTIVLAVTAIVSVAIAVAPWAVIDVVERQLIAIEALSIGFLPSSQLTVSIIGIIIAVICGFVIVLEMKQPGSRAVALAKLPEGVAEFATDSVAQRLKHEVELVPDVRLVTPRVTSRGNSVDIDVTVQTSPDVDVPDKTSEVHHALRANIDQMGLKLGRLKVNMAYAPYSTTVPQKPQ